MSVLEFAAAYKSRKGFASVTTGVLDAAWATGIHPESLTLFSTWFASVRSDPSAVQGPRSLQDTVLKEVSVKQTGIIFYTDRILFGGEP